MAAVRKKPALGAWIALDEAGRWEWLRQAHGRHFGRRRWRQSPIGTTFDLPGEQIVDLSSFFCAIGEAVNGPGGYFGQNMLGFDDCCVGRFGLTPPSVILWWDAALTLSHSAGATSPSAIKRKHRPPENRHATSCVPRNEV